MTSSAYHEAAHAVVAHALGLRVMSVRCVRCNEGDFRGEKEDDFQGHCRLHSDELAASPGCIAQAWAGVEIEIRSGHGSRRYAHDLQRLRLLHERLGDDAYYHAVSVSKLLIGDLRDEVERFATALAESDSGVLEGDALAAAFAPLTLGSHQHLLPTVIVKGDLLSDL